MSERELFFWGVLAFILLLTGVVFTVIEFKKLGKSLQNNSQPQK